MGKIEHKVGGRTFRIPEFDLMGWGTVREWTDANRGPITEAIAEALEIGIPAGLSQVPVFSMRETGIVMLLDRDAFEENISRRITHFLDIEDYERCSRLQALRDRL